MKDNRRSSHRFWVAAAVGAPLAVFVAVGCPAPSTQPSAQPGSTAATTNPTPTTSPATTSVTTQATYVGKTKCSTCHSTIAEKFNKSGHGYKLTKVVGGQAPTYPYSTITPPDGKTWNDISYVIGGYGWKARFVGTDGYIIAGATDSYKNQYNLPNQEVGTLLGSQSIKDGHWVGFNAGKQNWTYDCGTCHTTGFKAEGNQGGLTGIKGTWAEEGITCEACHGPGSNHATSAKKEDIKIDRTAATCGTCHSRGNLDSINAKGGFTMHHEQYEEMKPSKHNNFANGCVTCHDPHTGVIQLRKTSQQTTKATCESCHSTYTDKQASAAMKTAGVKCIDCHMPRSTKSAVGDKTKFTGDIRAHMFAIDPATKSQFISGAPTGEEGDAVTYAKNTLDWSCKSCHRTGGTASVQDDAALMARAKDYHK